MNKITGKVNYKEVLKGDTGYTFEPHVTVDGVLYWTNNGNLENPLPVNLHGKQGFMFIPHVDSEGNLSWSNTGELENPPTVNIKGDKGYFYTPHISEDGILTWSNNGNLENPQPFNISDLILNEVKESRVDTTGKTFTKLKERLDSDFKKLSESIKNNDTKDEVVQARTATTGENFMTLDDRIDHEVMRLREKIEVTMLEQEDKESHDISNTIDGMSSDMIIKGKTIKLDNGEIKSFGQEENKISILSSGKNLYTNEVVSSVNGTFEILNNGFIAESTFYTAVKVPKLDKSKSYYFQFDKQIISGDFDRVYYAVIYDETVKKTVTKANLTGSDRIVLNELYNPNNENKLYFYTGSGVASKCKFYNIQLFEGDSQSSIYKPYQKYKKDILLQDLCFDEGLRGINDISDELNSLRNIAIKKINKYINSNNETIKMNTIRNNTITFNYNFIRDTPKGKNSNPNIITNCFETNISCYSNDIEGCFGTPNGFFGSVLKTKLESQDINGITKYVKENFKECYYELAEPIESPFSKNINIKSFNDKTYVNFENSINGTSSFKVPVNTNKLINDLKFEKEDLKEKFNNLTNEFENFKTLMIQTLPYKGV